MSEQTTSQTAENAEHGYGAPPSLASEPAPRGTQEAEQEVTATPAAEPGSRRPILEGLELPQEVLDMVKQRRGEPMATPAGEAVDEPPPAEEEPEEVPGEGEGAGAEHEGKPEPAPQVAAEAPVPKEWPDSAKARVKDEAEKRRKATLKATTLEGERDQWKAEAEKLHGQLQETATRANAPQPTREDPLADVMDVQGLIRAKRQFWEIFEFAEKNPDGVDDYLIGKDANGNEIRMDYSRNDIVDMKVKAMQVLNEGIAVKAQYLQEVENYKAKAAEALPEMFSDEPNDTNRLANEIMRELPISLRATPKWPVYLADVVAGEIQRRTRGNGAAPAQRTVGGKPLSKSAAAILGAPKTPVAPGIARTRSSGEAVPQRARAVDIEKAKQAHIDSGFSSETLERLINIKRQSLAQPAGGRAPALV